MYYCRALKCINQNTKLSAFCLTSRAYTKQFPHQIFPFIFSTFSPSFLIKCCDTFSSKQNKRNIRWESFNELRTHFHFLHKITWEEKIKTTFFFGWNRAQLTKSCWHTLQRSIFCCCLFLHLSIENEEKYRIYMRCTLFIIVWTNLVGFQLLKETEVFFMCVWKLSFLFCATSFWGFVDLRICGKKDWGD